MDPNLPPEILLLLKASPWAAAFLWALRELFKLLSPITCVVAVRLARNKGERDALLKMFRAARTSSSRWAWRRSGRGPDE